MSFKKRNPTIEIARAQSSTLWCVLNGDRQLSLSNSASPKLAGGIYCAWSSSHKILYIESNIPGLPTAAPHPREFSRYIPIENYFERPEYFVEIINSEGERRRVTVLPPCPCRKITVACEQFFEENFRGAAGVQPYAVATVSGTSIDASIAGFLDGDYLLAPCTSFTDSAIVRTDIHFDPIEIRRHLRYEIGNTLDHLTGRRLTAARLLIEFQCTSKDGNYGFRKCGTITKLSIDSFSHEGCSGLFERADCKEQETERSDDAPFPPIMNGSFDFRDTEWFGHTAFVDATTASRRRGVFTLEGGTVLAATVSS